MLSCCRSKEEKDLHSKLEKIVVFGGGSFGTAMGVSLARQMKDLQVIAAWTMGFRAHSNAEVTELSRQAGVCTLFC